MEHSEHERRAVAEAARARERRERHTRYLLTAAAMLHRGQDLRFENRDLAGGVPLGRLHYLIDVDSEAFWKVFNELERRKGWR